MARTKTATSVKAARPDGLTIDQLSRETGMTARNIRAHQSRGLVPPPKVHSRTGYYEEEHVARIKLIQDMQAQGFNLKAIEKLVDLASGTSSQTLRFERSVLEPFGTEQPEVITAAELAELFGEDGDLKTLAKAEKIGVIAPLGDGTWEVRSPALLRAATELIELGIPLNHGLAVGEAIVKHTSAIARDFVRLFVQDVIDPMRKDGAISEPDFERAAEAVERLRPLASEAVMAGFGQVMTEAVERQVAKELSR